ncbi:MAG TPA: SMP-30/gluconolactonase/LRE family protein [Tepidisphaeraceae bacterium]|nr:SMP-30/gluconolactonase/LRE family protein [Tepidisphaeraceae bacterium]
MIRTFILLAALAAVSPLTYGDDFDIKNPEEFKKIIPEGAKVQKEASGFGFVEGPTWIKSGSGFLVFSDIPNNKIMKWTAKDGISVFRDDSKNSNGNTTDPDGLLVTAQHGSRSVTRTEKDGKITTLVDKYNDKALNSPNDVVVKSDGTIWFTDPDYGIPKGQTKEQAGNWVYRFDPKTNQLKVLFTETIFEKPNGLAFSPDEKILYIADSGPPRLIRSFEVREDGTVVGGEVFCKIDKGGPDGIRVDADGRVWSSAGDGVHIFDPKGKLIAKILVPESPANLCFGGEEQKTLFITARKSLYSIKTNVTGTSNMRK